MTSRKRWHERKQARHRDVMAGAVVLALLAAALGGSMLWTLTAWQHIGRMERHLVIRD